MDCDLRIVVFLIQKTYSVLVLVGSSEAYGTRGLGHEQRHDQTIYLKALCTT